MRNDPTIKIIDTATDLYGSLNVEAKNLTKYDLEDVVISIKFYKCKTERIGNSWSTSFGASLGSASGRIDKFLSGEVLQFLGRHYQAEDRWCSDTFDYPGIRNGKSGRCG